MPSVRLAAAAILVLSLACSSEPDSGPGEIVWDRDTCERCGMIIGDRRFAVQLRDAGDGHLHAFDDLGCALYWLDEVVADGRKRGTEASEFWSRDASGQHWLAAGSTRFAGGRETPMGYGFGPASNTDDQTLDLVGVRQKLRERKRERERTRR